MTEDPRIPLVRGAIGAFNEGDLPSLLEMMHPEVRSHIPPELGNPGDWEGIDGYVAMIAEWSEAWSEQVIELQEVELVDDRVVFVHCLQNLRGAGSGVPVEMETIFLVEFENERAIRFEIHPDRPSAEARL